MHIIWSIGDINPTEPDRLYRVSTYIRLALIRLSNAVCYEGLIFLEWDEREEGGSQRRGGEEEKLNMTKGVGCKCGQGIELCEIVGRFR